MFHISQLDVKNIALKSWLLESLKLLESLFGTMTSFGFRCDKVMTTWYN
jgi:hypothetical protein